MPPLNLGTVQTFDAQTGEPTSPPRPGFSLLPPPPEACQICAVQHRPEDPHNQQSIYYRLTFHAQHGRMPTWSDAMAHCAPAMRDLWRRHLITVMKRANLDIPKDLQQ